MRFTITSGQAKEYIQRSVRVTSSGCWEFCPNSKNRRMKKPRYKNITLWGKTQGAHRWSYLLFKGEIPNGLFVCHECDNPPCCNPEHLFLGTREENFEDCRKKGRNATGDRNGNAKLSNEQVDQIRKEYDASRGSLDRLAEKHGVCSAQIRNIIRGKQHKKGKVKKWNKNIVSRKKSLVGETFDRLTVVAIAESRGPNSCSLCRCVCGTEKIVLNFNLLASKRKNKPISCGCYAREAASQRCKTNPPRLITGNHSKENRT